MPHLVTYEPSLPNDINSAEVYGAIFLVDSFTFDLYPFCLANGLQAKTTVMITVCQLLLNRNDRIYVKNSHSIHCFVDMVSVP